MFKANKSFPLRFEMLQAKENATLNLMQMIKIHFRNMSNISMDFAYSVTIEFLQKDIQIEWFYTISMDARDKNIFFNFEPVCNKYG